MKKSILATLLALSISIQAEAADGLVNVQSAFTVKQTAERMENLLKEKGMTIFNRIKHSQGADKVGITLRDTQLIIFGNPKVGSLLMKCQQSIAIDLPQKALIWQDEEAKVWISYNSPGYLQKRHHMVGCEGVIGKIEKALAAIAKSVATQ